MEPPITLADQERARVENTHSKSEGPFENTIHATKAQGAGMVFEWSTSVANDAYMVYDSIP